MKTSKNGISLIQHFETCKLYVYDDATGLSWFKQSAHKGNPSIGWGYRLYGSEVEDYIYGISQQKADELFKTTLIKFETLVNVQTRVPLNQPQYDSLVSLTYNIGPESFKNSTLLKLINQHKFMEAADQFLLWDHAGKEVVQGLLNRRKAEQFLFKGGSMDDLINKYHWFQNA